MDEAKIQHAAERLLFQARRYKVRVEEVNRSMDRLAESLRSFNEAFRQAERDAGVLFY